MWLLFPALDLSFLPVPSRPAQKVVSISTLPLTKGRYSIRVRDGKGRAYHVRIFANNEKVEVDRFPGGEFWGKGKRYYTGTYQVTLRRTGARTQRVQRIPLFGTDTSPSAEGVFTPWNPRVFVLRGEATQQADLLLITQYECSNSNSVRAFFINSGRLVPMVWRVSSKETVIGQSFSSHYPLKYRHGSIYETFYHTIAEDYGSHHRTWRFEPNMHQMVLLRDKRSP